MAGDRLCTLIMSYMCHYFLQVSYNSPLNYIFLFSFLFISDKVQGWMPFADQALMNPGTSLGGHASVSANPFGDLVGAAAGGNANYAGANPYTSYAPQTYHSFRNNPNSIGSICYCDIRINKMGTPGDLLFKLHYPTLNADNCQAAIQQCAMSCKNQAQRQLTGNVLFEEGGLENVAPEKDVSVGTILCREHNKVIAPPGVIASVFAKPDACGRAAPIYDLTGEESRLCCTMTAHPYIRTENILVFSPECIAGTPPAAAPAGKGGAPPANAANAPAEAANAAGNSPPAQAPEPVPFNPAPIMQMPTFRHYDPMNAMMLNAFG